mgnify:CR=1 FL=1
MRNKVGIEKLLNIVQEQREVRGLLGTWGLYSLKLKAVPHPKPSKRLPLSALLPDALQYPLAASTSLKVGFGQEGRANDASLMTLV